MSIWEFGKRHYQWLIIDTLSQYAHRKKQQENKTKYKIKELRNYWPSCLYHCQRWMRHCVGRTSLYRFTIKLIIVQDEFMGI